MKSLPLLLFCITLIFSACEKGQTNKKNLPSVAKTMDKVVTRLYKEMDKKALDTISHAFAEQYLTAEEKEALATQYWKVKVNVPTTVSLMRNKGQEVVPFWLETAGFALTAMEVKNVHNTYEVWQKDFEAGEIQLGINGFGKHRPVYFLGLTPQNPEDELEITPVFPEKQHVEVFDVGAFTYHDWSGLTLTQVPEALKGQQLLTTIRGRAREAHMVNAFRTTDFPTGTTPDQILLTWSDAPENSMDIQWRTAASVSSGLARYWEKGTKDTLETEAEKFEMEDRLLQNDRYMNRFTAKLRSLAPATTYEYIVGNKDTGWSSPESFTTAAGENEPFSFVWFGDVHNSNIWGNLIQKSEKQHPNTAFYYIAGDLVNTGLHRDDWDKLFQYAGSTISRKPLMAVPGNHDSQDGLGAWMFEEMLSLPSDSPSPEMAGRTYAFNYGNALFLMIDSTFPNEDQTDWIKRKLEETEATWKIAVFHFPPYNEVEPYEDIQAEWGPLFDKYHVDMVMGGHFHYYMRSNPINDGQVVQNPADGTIYWISIGTTGKNKGIEKGAYAAVQFPAEHLYQYITLDGKTMKAETINYDGETVDQFSINKK
jgi:glutaredoxin